MTLNANPATSEDRLYEPTEAEMAVRIDLAACYRLAAALGWDDLIYTHMTARVPDSDDYLINPMGLMFEEVTASNLVRITPKGQIVDDRTGLGYNVAGFVIHGAVHHARPDVGCVIHLHPLAGVAVSCQEGGLLPISQAAMMMDIALHDYEGLALDEDERARLSDNLGLRNHMILRNHGLLTCGSTVPAAFIRLYELERACEIQLAAQSGGAALCFPKASVSARLKQQVVPKDGAPSLTERLGWPALMRRLEKIDPGFRQ